MNMPILLNYTQVKRVWALFTQAPEQVLMVGAHSYASSAMVIYDTPISCASHAATWPGDLQSTVFQVMGILLASDIPRSPPAIISSE